MNVIPCYFQGFSVPTLRDKPIFAKPPILVAKAFENKDLLVEKNGSEYVESVVGLHACLSEN